MQYDLNVEQGCVFYKLFLRAFPSHFKPNSVYAHYPVRNRWSTHEAEYLLKHPQMTIPSENRKILRNLGRESHYSWDRPAFIPPRINITSYIGAKTVLEQQRDFRVTWGATLAELMGDGGAKFMLYVSPLHQDEWVLMCEQLG